MNITPVDKTPDGDDAEDSALSRRSSVFRAYLGRFVSWLGNCVSSTRISTKSRDRSRSTSAEVLQPVTETEPEPVKATDCPAFKNFPGREQPLAHPARNSPGINTPDVVSIETDDGLRLSVPENPDAELTSDVWMSVEP